MPVNCPDQDDFERKTLGELAEMISDGLGFFDQGTTSPRTLAEMREEVLALLGLADPMATPTATVSSLIERMADMMGMAAMQAFAPGVRDEMIAFLNKAQQTLYRRLELDKGGAAPPPLLALDSDSTFAVDCELTLSYALAMAKAKYGQADAKSYQDMAERALADMVQRRPPNIIEMVDRALANAQRTAARRPEMGQTTDGPLSNDDDLSTIDAQPIVLLALANLKAKIGQPDSKGYAEQYEAYMRGRMVGKPPHADTTIRRILRMAQESLYRRYDLFRMERFFTWTLQPGERFYGIGRNDEYRLKAPIITVAGGEPVLNPGPSIPAGTHAYRVSAFGGPGNRDQESAPSPAKVFTTIGNSRINLGWQAVPGAIGYNIFGRTVGGEQLIDSVSSTTYQDNGVRTPIGALPAPASPDEFSRKLDPRKVHWVGVSQGDNSWRSLRCGIHPTLYTSSQTGVPTHYEIRHCVEIWPSPVDGWKLRIKGDFGLDPFESDSDLTTIDWQAVYLTGLGEAKVHFKQPDAQLAIDTARIYVGDLIAGSHHTARYIPGEREPRNAVRPVTI